MSYFFAIISSLRILYQRKESIKRLLFKYLLNLLWISLFFDWIILPAPTLLKWLIF